MSSILVVDDDPGLQTIVRDALERERYEVTTVPDGGEALALFDRRPFDLVVSEIAMPVLSGHDLVRELRKRSRVPILMLTVCGDEAEKVRLLDLGADDYVVKPFGTAELLARVRGLLRRTTSSGGTAGLLHFGELTVDLKARSVERGGRHVHLTPTEFGLLAALLARPGSVRTTRQLTSDVWGDAADVSRDTIRVHIFSLRRKLEADPGAPRWIRTEPWVGYRFVPD